jgi:hypothetical protein
MPRRWTCPLLLVLVTATAHAQTTPPQDAAGLKQLGDDAMHAMHFREALQAYDAAYALKPDAAILYNRARALEGLGEYPGALDALMQFERDAPDAMKARVPKLVELEADLRGRVATLAVHCPIPGATVLLRHKVEGSTPLPWSIRTASGPAVLEVQAAGYLPFRQTMDLPGGRETTIEAPLEKLAAAPTPEPGTGRKAASITLFAGTGLLAGAAVVALVLRADDISSLNAACPGGACPAARQDELTSTRNRALLEEPLAVVFGATALVAATVGFIVWPWSASKAKIALGGASVSMVGSF